MKTQRLLMMAIVVLGCGVAAHDKSGVDVSSLQPGDEQLIRDARARSNQAIAAHDLPAIARAWMENVHVVSSTSAQTAGRTANQERMRQQFSNRPDTVYVRAADGRRRVCSVGRGIGARRVDRPMDRTGRRPRDWRDVSGAMAPGGWALAHSSRALRTSPVHGSRILPSASLTESNTRSEAA